MSHEAGRSGGRYERNVAADRPRTASQRREGGELAVGSASRYAGRSMAGAEARLGRARGTGCPGPPCRDPGLAARLPALTAGASPILPPTTAHQPVAPPVAVTRPSTSSRRGQPSHLLRRCVEASGASMPSHVELRRFAHSASPSGAVAGGPSTTLVHRPRA
jgi:hypothetical protein